MEGDRERERERESYICIHARMYIYKSSMYTLMQQRNEDQMIKQNIIAYLK